MSVSYTHLDVYKRQEQMSTLISEKLLLLRQNYEDKVSQAGHIIMNSHIRSLEQGRALLLAYEQLYLCLLYTSRAFSRLWYWAFWNTGTQ